MWFMKLKTLIKISRFIKMYLLPDTSPMGKRKSRMRKRTRHPIFNESFSVIFCIFKSRSHYYCSKLTYLLQYKGLTKSDVERRTLLITVWHYDILNKNEKLGQVLVDLSEYPWNSGQNGTWYELLKPNVRFCVHIYLLFILHVIPSFSSSFFYSFSSF